jgi:hypothetical protein
MATNVWDEWLRGGEAPLAKMYNNPTAGYSPITGHRLATAREIPGRMVLVLAG